nr:hypothetical protein [Niallia taxi]
MTIIVMLQGNDAQPIVDRLQIMPDDFIIQYVFVLAGTRHVFFILDKKEAGAEQKTERFIQ